MKFAILKFLLTPIQLIGLLSYFIVMGYAAGFMMGQRIMSEIISANPEQQKRLR